MLQPVNTLPPEIISRIAQCSRGHAFNGAKNIIPLTHVCRYWRESMISAPEIWTSVTDFPMGLWALCLERSKTVPLQLQFSRSRIGGRSWFRDLMAPHIQNTETLRFEEIKSIVELTEILPNFPQSMPNLRSLALARYDESNDDNPNPSPIDDYDDAPWDPIFDPFGSFPNTLKSLSLDDIPLYPSFLKLRTLTELSLYYRELNAPLDTILDFVEENRSLKSVYLSTDSPPDRASQPQAVIANPLQRLSISSCDIPTIRTVISSIPLRRRGHMEIEFHSSDEELGLNDILSNISTTHLPNLLSPTSMRYQTFPRRIRLAGPNGSFSYVAWWTSEYPFTEFPVLPLSSIREFHLVDSETSVPLHPPSLPALEALTVQSRTHTSRLFSTLFPNPSLFPSLKTLGFLDCDLSEGFMKELARFASDRKRTASAWLHRVLIIHQDGKFPSGASIRALRASVAIVDIRMDDKFPADLV